MKRARSLVMSAVVAAMVTSTTEHVQAKPSYTFTKVAGTGMAAPGGAFDFAVLEAPGLAAGKVVFQARNASATSEGIYTTFEGPLTRVADFALSPPGSAGNFLALGIRPQIDKQGVSYIGVTAGPNVGIYKSVNGITSTVADYSTNVPGSASPFFQLGGVSMRGGKVAFIGSGGSGGTGVYWESHSGLERVVDLNTVNPAGTGNKFISLHNVRHDGNKVSFIGEKDPSAVFVSDGSGAPPRFIVDIFGSLPGPGGPFHQFSGDYGFDNGVLAFESTNLALGLSAIFTVFPTGDIQRILDSNTPAPADTGGGTFTNFGGTVGIQNGNLLFSAGTSSNPGAGRGVYRTFRGAVAKVLAPGDTLEGKLIKDIRFRPEGIDGDDVGLAVRFMDDTFAIYTAPVLRGSDKIVPVLPVTQSATAAAFDDTPTGSWVDAPLAEALTFSAAPESLFSGIAELPDGYGNSYEILIGSISLGSFKPGDAVSFPVALGAPESVEAGVNSFTIRGIDDSVIPLGAEGFAVKLNFTSPSGDFVATAVPEPASIAPIALAALAGFRRRYRSR